MNQNNEKNDSKFIILKIIIYYSILYFILFMPIKATIFLLELPNKIIL